MNMGPYLYMKQIEIADAATFMPNKGPIKEGYRGRLTYIES
jgi:hypothetical protein